MAATNSLLARAATAISDRSSLPIRAAAAAATVAVGTLFGAHVASGQQLADHAPPSALGATMKQPNQLPASMCSDAIKIGLATLERHNGKVSRQLVDSFLAFGRSACDLNTVFVRVEGTEDEQAFGEFRVQLIVLRRDYAARQPTLTK